MRLITSLVVLTLTTYYITGETEEVMPYPYNHYIFTSSTVPLDVDEELRGWNMMDDDTTHNGQIDP